MNDPELRFSGVRVIPLMDVRAWIQECSVAMRTTQNANESNVREGDVNENEDGHSPILCRGGKLTSRSRCCKVMPEPNSVCTHHYVFQHQQR